MDRSRHEVQQRWKGRVCSPGQLPGLVRAAGKPRNPRHGNPCLAQWEPLWIPRERAEWPKSLLPKTQNQASPRGWFKRKRIGIPQNCPNYYSIGWMRKGIRRNYKDSWWQRRPWSWGLALGGPTSVSWKRKKSREDLVWRSSCHAEAPCDRSSLYHWQKDGRASSCCVGGGSFLSLKQGWQFIQTFIYRWTLPLSTIAWSQPISAGRMAR